MFLKFMDITFAYKHSFAFPLVIGLLWEKHSAFYLLNSLLSVLLHEAILTF